MTIFRTYWPICALLISFLIYSIVQRRKKENLKDLLGFEVWFNLHAINTALPKTMPTQESEQDLLDSARVLAWSRRKYSFHIYDNSFSSLDVLKTEEKKQILEFYQTMRLLQAIAEDIGSLLQIHERSREESHRLITSTFNLNKLSPVTFQLGLQCLPIFGYNYEKEKANFDNTRGTGLASFQEMDAIISQQID